MNDFIKDNYLLVSESTTFIKIRCHNYTRTTTSKNVYLYKYNLMFLTTNTPIYEI